VFKQILANELKILLNNSTDLILLDVRQPYEHEEYSISGSILIPLNELPQRINELEQYKLRQIVVYCKAGVRSAMACRFMATHGFKHLINLADGIMAW